MQGVPVEDESRDVKVPFPDSVFIPPTVVGILVQQRLYYSRSVLWAEAKQLYAPRRFWSR